MSSPPFKSPLREAITSAYRRPEPECLPPLIAAATLPAGTMQAATALARRLVERMRAKSHGGGVEGLIHEYSLASEEGVALMCLAEALLRIPDDETRDALIRDKIGGGDWEAHLGKSPSLFVNAATWGLLLTGKLTATHSERGLSAALTRLVARGGEPLIRAGVNLAMRLMGEQFVAGQTIDEALDNGRPWVRKGFRYSYDMLGEAAVTAAQARRYFDEYEAAIQAIGSASAGRGIYDGPGISIKLSALHPRYSRSQIERVHAELYPRLKALAVQAHALDIGLNIDAEEADRLELSLDLLERLCFEPELAGWHGIGFVVQAYQKRCTFVIDWLIDLARRSGHRLMVRLVKGAYWDGEIKRAQLDGLEGFPVFTRKIHTDVSYIACARKLLAATDAVFPQIATHNALSLATIHAIAPKGRYEFQCLHGMGESLYEEVVGPGKLGVPCRIYAPVGTHETLLAYLVRRLLENGANTSFVNQIADPDFPVDQLLADPVEQARALEPVGRPHDRIALPRDLFGAERPNSMGLDLTNEQRLAALAQGVQSRELARRSRCWATGRATARPASCAIRPTPTTWSAPSSRRRRSWSMPPAPAPWSGMPRPRRVRDCLRRVADRMEARMLPLIGLIVREAGKTFANAVGEVREAVDFLRYYAAQVLDWSNELHRPLGVVACISPWNFPLSIFTGQIAGCARRRQWRHRQAGGRDAADRRPGGAAVPRRRLAARRAAVPARRWQGRRPAGRQSDDRRRRVHRLDRGGALDQQGAVEARPRAVHRRDGRAEYPDRRLLVLARAAGERCAHLGVRFGGPALLGAARALPAGRHRRSRPADAEGRDGGARCRQSRSPVDRCRAGDLGRGAEAAHRSYRGDARERPRRDPGRHGARACSCRRRSSRSRSIAELPGEVFGPVLHVLRYPREEMDDVVRQANATGFGLTFGVHSRIDETIERATALSAAGNQYVNRTVIGAVVGVQPFGGHGLSGTGPKAGGPLYVRRLLSACPPLRLEGLVGELSGPVGERNEYLLRSKGTILCVARDPADLQAQANAARATGNRATMDPDDPSISAALFAGSRDELLALTRRLAERDGPIVPVHVAPYPLEFLVDEVSLSVNTAAAGGNASLMSIG